MIYTLKSFANSLVFIFLVDKNFISRMGFFLFVDPDGFEFKNREINESFYDWGVRFWFLSQQAKRRFFFISWWIFNFLML
jgi:hypothetical protein